MLNFHQVRVSFLNADYSFTICCWEQGDHCPICLTPFAVILEDVSSVPDERSGVTKLQCGHIFCIAE